MAKQIAGWLFLTLGVLVILWSCWASFEVFTNRRPAPAVFETVVGEPSSNGGPSSDPQEQLSQTIKEQLENILSVDTLPKVFNLMAWSMLAFILILAGNKIAGIGIKLLSIKKEEPAVRG